MAVFLRLGLTSFGGLVAHLCRGGCYAGVAGVGRLVIAGLPGQIFSDFPLISAYFRSFGRFRGVGLFAVWPRSGCSPLPGWRG